MTIIILDRPRHEQGVGWIREAGARIRFITDGDVSAALFAVTGEGGVDLLWGIGGTPEGVLSAAAIKCLGGQLLAGCGRATTTSARPRSTPATTSSEVLDADALVAGEDVFFAATGVTDGDLLQGVRYRRRQGVDRVAGDALALGNRAHGQRPPRPGEAARGHRRALRLIICVRDLVESPI